MIIVHYIWKHCSGAVCFTSWHFEMSLFCFLWACEHENVCLFSKDRFSNGNRILCMEKNLWCCLTIQTADCHNFVLSRVRLRFLVIIFTSWSYARSLQFWQIFLAFLEESDAKFRFILQMKYVSSSCGVLRMYFVMHHVLTSCASSSCVGHVGLIRALEYVGKYIYKAFMASVCLLVLSAKGNSLYTYMHAWIHTSSVCVCVE